MTVPDAAIVTMANAISAAAHNSTTADDRAAANNRTAANDCPASMDATAHDHATTNSYGLCSGRRSYCRKIMDYERTGIRRMKTTRQSHEGGHKREKVYLEHKKSS
jgi:hypothetical protein